MLKYFTFCDCQAEIDRSLETAGFRVQNTRGAVLWTQILRQFQNCECFKINLFPCFKHISGPKLAGTHELGCMFGVKKYKINFRPLIGTNADA